MSKVWLTSDLHIGHRLVAASRCRTPEGAPAYPDFKLIPGWFGDYEVARHDQILANNWDSVVRDGDTVWVLGDLSSGTNAGTERALQWIAERPGTKHLVSGNHCPTHPMHRDSHKWQKLFTQRVFQSVQPYARRRVPLLPGSLRGNTVRDILLCHFPYEDKCTGIGNAGLYGQYRLPDESLPIVHGHTHSREKVTRSDSGTLQLHVGVDAWDGHLVPLEWIVEQVQAEMGITTPPERENGVQP